MNESRSSRVVRSADLLPPPPIGRALLFAGLAAIVGAVAWGLLAYYANLEHGALAWAIGGLVGFAVLRSGGHGMLLAGAAGCLALLAIGSGKHLAFSLTLEREVLSNLASVSQAEHDERLEDAANWVALGDQPSEQQVLEFMEKAGYENSSADEFAEEVGVSLTEINRTKPTLDEWRQSVVATVREEVSFLDYLREDFHPLDIVFAILGIITAFGMVSKATDQLKVQARQALRAEQDAKAPAGEPAE